MSPARGQSAPKGKGRHIFSAFTLNLQKNFEIFFFSHGVSAPREDRQAALLSSQVGEPQTAFPVLLLPTLLPEACALQPVPPYNPPFFQEYTG